MVLVIVLLIGTIWAVWKILESNQPFPTSNAAPAPDSDPQVRACATSVHHCMVLGCPDPGTVVVAGWRTCIGHDARVPFDRELVELEALWMSS